MCGDSTLAELCRLVAFLTELFIFILLSVCLKSHPIRIASASHTK